MGSDGEPDASTTIDYEVVTSLNVQSGERRSIGIVAGRIDGFTSTIHLSREYHVSQIAAADGYTSN